MGGFAISHNPGVIVAVALLASTIFAAESPVEQADSGPDVKLYGYIKLDAAYDDSTVNPGNFARWVESESVLDHDSQFSMTANQTRVGLRISNPAAGRITTHGKLEVDFYGTGASENKSGLMLRHAYVAFAWPDKNLEVLAGQTADIISPLAAPTVNYSASWWQGNIGYRRAQIRVTKGFELSGTSKLEVTAGPTRTISDTTFGGGSIDSGADAAVPTIQGRVGLSFQRAEGESVTVGVSGHWGKEDQHTTDAFGTITGHLSVDTWSANLDVRIPVSDSLLLQGEWFHGENLNAFLGGIGQKGEIEVTGGWIAATITPGPKWRINLGGGIDDPVDDDLTVSEARTWNGVLFANADHSLTPDLTVAFELMFLRTRYLGLEDGGAWRQQLAIIYEF